MKRLGVICVLLGAGLSAEGQLLLNQGDSWTYQFGSLPFRGATNAFLTTVHGEFGFRLGNGSFQTGDMLAYDMFENNASEVPICSQTLSAAPSGDVVCTSPDAWQDLQGVVRFRMLSGSVTVDNVTL